VTESLIDVGIDVGKARLAYAWPAWQMVGSVDLTHQSLQRHIQLIWLQNWLRSKLPEGVQLWIDRPLFAGTGTESGARLTETVAAVLTTQEWELTPQIVFNQTWKSQTVGYPATKDETKAWLIEHHPLLARRCTTEDEYDAMVIGLYGKGRSEGVILAPQPPKPKRRHPRERQAAPGH
jgi:hypothetical protein